MRRIIVVLFIILSVSVVYAKSVTKTVTADGSTNYTDPISPAGDWGKSTDNMFMNVSEDHECYGTLPVFVFGTGWEATVSIQYRTSPSGTWYDLYDGNGTQVLYTGPVHFNIIDCTPGIQYRIGIANGSFTSGTVILQLGN